MIIQKQFDTIYVTLFNLSNGRSICKLKHGNCVTFRRNINTPHTLCPHNETWDVNELANVEFAINE